MNLRWDPIDDRRYARRWKNPSSDPATTMRGANRLAIEEACVDCYDESEQCSALVEMAGQELAVPFPATVMGEAVEVIDTASSKYDPLGLDLVVERRGKRYAIAAQSVELVKPFPDGHLYLAALLQWRTKL